MDIKDIKPDDLKSDIRGGRVDFSEKYDDKVTFGDILEKDVLDLMGFSNLTEEKKAALHKKVQDTIEVRVAEQIFERLNDKEKEEYDQLLVAQKNDEAYQYLKDRGIIVEEIITTEAIILKLEFYEDSKVIRDEGNKIINKQVGKQDE